MILMALVAVALIADPPPPLAGTVVTDDGMAVAGAEVVLTSPAPGQSLVVARGQSGADGGFRLDRPVAVKPTDKSSAATLWVVAPGRLVSIVKLSEAVPGADEPVTVVMRPAARTVIQVESPDGAPVQGARISVQRILSQPRNHPQPVIDLTKQTTGPDGRAVIEGFGPADVGEVEVVADGFGIQPRWLNPAKPGLKQVRLIAAAPLRGRLVPEKGDERLAKGWCVRAWTNDFLTDASSWYFTGFGSAATDDAGRFTIAEIASGSLQLVVFHPDGPDLLPVLPKAMSVHEEGENELEIPLRRASTLTGLVVERGTGKPVVGMRVVLFTSESNRGRDAETDAEGRYTFRCFAGLAHVWGPKAPEGYVSDPGLNQSEIAIPTKPGRVDVGKTELLKAAPPLQGTVRDESGRPVAGAEVRVVWSGTTPLGDSSGANLTKSDAHGDFSLGGFAPGATLTIAARSRGRSTEQPLTAEAGAEKPLVLRVVPKATVALEGRALGTGGEPVVGAIVRLSERGTKEKRPGQIGRRAPMRHNGHIVFEGIVQIYTGLDGSFRTPKELDREGSEYLAEYFADGYHPGKTSWVSAGDGDLVTLPAVTLRRSLTLRVVTGRVVDRDGGAVAGARVFQSGDGPRRSDATTDAAGRFRLAGVYEGRVLIFAEKAGFRFGGAVVAAGNTSVELRLARAGEQAAADLKTLPSPMGRAEERALGRELLAPVLAAARAGTIGPMAQRVMPALARLDPERVLTMLEERVIGQPRQVLSQVALGQLEDDPGKAIATIESDFDLGARAWGFLALAGAVSPSDSVRRGELLDRAFAEARKATGSEAKMPLFGEIADRWLAFGEKERASAVLRAGRAVIDGSGERNEFYMTDKFAEVLAAIDLPTARAIFEAKGTRHTSSPDDQNVRRHEGEAAVRVAATNPAEAEKLLAHAYTGENVGDREDLIFRIAVNMARADLPRARKLLQTIADKPDDPAFDRPALVPYGLGLMASEQARINPALARRLLDEAFVGLLKLCRDPGDQPRLSAPVLMAALLPVVERIDPGRLAERVWLAASCRPPREQEPDGNAVADLAALAMLVSRYDRAAADAIAAPALERLPMLIGPMARQGDWEPRVVGLITAYDPRAIGPLIGAGKTQPDGTVTVQAAARLAAAEMLGRPIGERRRAASEQSVYPFKLLRERW